MQQAFLGGLNALDRATAPSVVTIGSFDGVHLGHQQILARLTAKARSLNAASTVIIFEPQPQEYFAKAATRPRLMRLREKVTALLAAGVDRVLCLRFNQRLSALSAEAFVRQVLVEGLKVKHLEIGDDFRFGCDRTGDFAYLQRAGEHYGFSVANSETFVQGNERVSSTRIRQVLAEHRLADASALLGKPYAIAGRVVYGRQLGRTIGVPTANIGLGRYAPAVNGVYAVTANWQGRSLQGVANVGVKPTVGAAPKPLLEVHFFDFAENLYGECLTVQFCQALRAEKKFDSLDALKAQIQTDIEQAKQYFTSASSDALALSNSLYSPEN